MRKKSPSQIVLNKASNGTALQEDNQAGLNRINFKDQSVAESPEVRRKDDDEDKEANFRCLLSRSVEPKTDRSGLMPMPNTVSSRFDLSLYELETTPYQDCGNMSIMSARPFSLNQTTHLSKNMPYMVNVLNTIPAATEPCNSTYKGCKSNHNHSVGPTDDNTSQISSCR